MNQINKAEEPFFQSMAKKNLDFCEKFFIEKLGTDIAIHLNFIILRLQEILRASISFGEKQLINDIIKKINNNKTDFSQDFKQQLKINMQEQFKSKTLNNGNLGFSKINLDDNEYIEEKKSIDLVNSSIQQTLGEDLVNVVKATNYLMQDNKNVYSSEVLTQTIFFVLHKYLTSTKSISIASKAFAEIWPEKLKPYYEKMSDHLNTNDIYKKMEEHAVIKTEFFKDRELVPDMNHFFNSIEDERKNLLAEEENKKIAEAERLLAIERANIKVEVIDPAIEKTKKIKSIVHDFLDVLSSQQLSQSSVNINDLIKETTSNNQEPIESKILSIPQFTQTINGINKQIIKITPEVFQKNSLYKKQVITELLQNKGFANHMSENDFAIISILSKTYESIMNNEQINIYQKTILFMTQIFVLEYSLKEKSFFTDPTNPARLFLDYIFNNETFLHSKIGLKYQEVLTKQNNITTIDNNLFISLVNEFKKINISDLAQQQNTIKDSIQKIEKEEQLEYYYYKIKKLLLTLSNKTEYIPIKSFIDKIWCFHYTKYMHKKIDLSIFENQNFNQFLSLSDKIYWQKTITLFESMIFISNNRNNSQMNMDKSKEALKNINEGLSKLIIELSIDEKYIKPLFLFLKYYHDVVAKTSNPEHTEVDLNKIKPKELEYEAEINQYLSTIISLEKTNLEIVNSEINLKELLIVNNWYSLSGKNFKLLYISPKEHNFILMNSDLSTFHEYSKPKIWYILKNKALHNITENYSKINFLNILAKSTEAVNIN